MGVRCADDTDFAQRARWRTPRGVQWGVQKDVEGYEIYKIACTVQQVRRDLAVGTYQTCVCPFTPAGARRRRQEKQQASWDEGWLPGATGVTLWLWLARQVPTMSPVGA